MTKTISQKLRAAANAGQPKPNKSQRVRVVRVERANPKPSRRTRRQRGNRAGLGSSLPGVLGTALNIGTSMARLFGRGDYRINQNSLFSGGIPTFSTLEAPMRFRHKEMIGIVNSSTVYKVQQTLAINPGLLAPILAQFAKSFTLYNFHGLVFMFNSTSGTAVGGTNTAMGTVGMVANYDPSLGAFSTRQQAEEYVGAQAGPPSGNLMLPVECKPQSTMLERRFVRSAPALPAGKTYEECDLATFQLFTDGVQTVSTIGELWVAYDVEFFLPKIDVNASAAADYYNLGTNVNTSSVWASATPVTQTYTYLSSSGLLSFNTGGQYKVLATCVAPSAGAFNPTPSGTGGMVINSITYPGGSAANVNFAVEIDVTVPTGAANTTNYIASGLSLAGNFTGSIVIIKKPVILSLAKTDLEIKVEKLEKLLASISSIDPRMARLLAQVADEEEHIPQLSAPMVPDRTNPQDAEHTDVDFSALE